MCIYNICVNMSIRHIYLYDIYIYIYIYVVCYTPIHELRFLSIHRTEAATRRLRILWEAIDVQRLSNLTSHLEESSMDCDGA